MLLGTQKINKNGNLEIGGCDCVELAKEFGTPLYVLDEAAFRANCQAYINAFKPRYNSFLIKFAAKALLNKTVCQIVEQEGFGLDVASAGELMTAVSAGFPTNKISFNGNNKSESELELALQNNVGQIIVDNELEIELLSKAAERLGKTADVILRTSPGVDPDTHKHISTGQTDTKFGLNIKSGAARHGFDLILSKPNLNLVGFHCHVGSQLLDPSTIIDGAKEMAKFVVEINQYYGYTPQYFNVGGGVGIRYIESHQSPDLNDFAEKLTNDIKFIFNKARIDLPTLMLEPGRSIAGEAGITLYTIGSIKKVIIKHEPGFRNYVMVDGGLSDNPRPVMYGAQYTVHVANKMNQKADTEVTISGKHCETDTLMPKAFIAEPQTGDILAVLSTGAYNYSMSSNYNRFTRPAMVLVNDGNSDVIVQRETLDELLRNDLIPERFKAKEPASL